MECLYKQYVVVTGCDRLWLVIVWCWHEVGTGGEGGGGCTHRYSTAIRKTGVMQTTLGFSLWLETLRPQRLYTGPWETAGALLMLMVSLHYILHTMPKLPAAHHRRVWLPLSSPIDAQDPLSACHSTFQESAEINMSPIPIRKRITNNFKTQRN